MKQITILLCLCFFLPGIGFSQYVPMGMKYQAVARDTKGQILADQELQLNISLYADTQQKEILYSEEHETTSTELGLFTLTIGEGRVTTGRFEAIPWSSEEVWMEVAIRTDDASEFITISNSKMLSVPYAFHAATADELTGDSHDGRGGGTLDPDPSSKNWLTLGNAYTNPEKDKLGTLDSADLVFVTHGRERMRITEEGHIRMKNNLSVEQNVYLNTYIPSPEQIGLPNVGQTINFGDFTVENGSNTHLTGNARIDGQVAVLNPTESTNPLTGAVVVEGGAGILKNLNVGGNSSFGGQVNFGSMVHITDLTPSVNPATGALVVDGGVGIGQRLNVHDRVMFNNQLDVAGVTSINNTSSSTAANNGALIIKGGAGIGQNLNIGNDLNVNNNASILGRAGIGNLYGNVRFNITAQPSDYLPFNVEVAGTNNKFNMNADGNIYLRASKSGASNSTGNFAMMVDGQDQGILVKLNGSSFPNSGNNYLSFWGANNNVRGAIEGQTLTELHDSFDWYWFHAMAAARAALKIAAVAADIFGADDGDMAVIDGIELVADGAEWVKAYIEAEKNVGIAFVSGSADYAEWLKKENPTEEFSFGDVVAVNGGIVSKKTEQADQYMVVSMAPIVLGNMPEQGQEANYAKIAFMGQVPVKVKGSVNIGDYILPSGDNDGLARAVAKSEMSIQDYRQIVGMAWSEGYSEKGYSLINVAIGINSNSLVDKIEDQENEIALLKTNLNAIGDYLASKDPSFNRPEGMDETKLVVNNEKPVTRRTTESDNKSIMAKREELKSFLLKNTSAVENILADARQMLDEQNIDYKKFPKIEQFLTDPAFFVNSLGKDPSEFRN